MKNLKENILFVDDEPQAIKYFKKAFDQQFNVLTTNSVHSAMNIIEQKPDEIAVVVTDQRMPEKQGMELLDYVYQHYPNIVRILTTAYCDSDTAIAAINKAEVFRYITKPWDIKELQSSLIQAFSRFAKSANSKQAILESFGEDCSHWLSYSTHAHGDQFVYRSGLEAIACQYNKRIDQYFQGTDGQHIKSKINMIIDKYTKDAVLQKIELQGQQDFISNLTH